MKPVLFVLSIKNYEVFHGFRLVEDKHTVHPDDQEILLMEGLQIYVLKVEEIHIKTSNWIYRELNDRILTIIHLYHDCAPAVSSS